MILLDQVSVSNNIASLTLTVMATIGNACRFKVVGWLKKKFSSPKDAARFYEISCTCNKEVQTEALPDPPVKCSIGVQTMEVAEVEAEVRLAALSHEFSDICKQHFNVDVPTDFLVLSLSAMDNLAGNDRSNVLYSLAKGIGTIREDESDSLFPVKRMPLGMVEYAANFFSHDTINQVISCPIETSNMYVVCLFAGSTLS